MTCTNPIIASFYRWREYNTRLIVYLHTYLNFFKGLLIMEFSTSTLKVMKWKAAHGITSPEGLDMVVMVAMDEG